jgi:hypothetical protein
MIGITIGFTNFKNLKIFIENSQISIYFNINEVNNLDVVFFNGPHKNTCLKNRVKTLLL